MSVDSDDRLSLSFKFPIEKELKIVEKLLFPVGVSRFWEIIHYILLPHYMAAFGFILSRPIFITDANRNTDVKNETLLNNKKNISAPFKNVMNN